LENSQGRGHQIGYEKEEWYKNLSEKDQGVVDALVGAQFFQGDMEPLQQQEYVPASKVQRIVKYQRHEVDELLSDTTRLYLEEYHPKDETSNEKIEDQDYGEAIFMTD